MYCFPRNQSAIYYSYTIQLYTIQIGFSKLTSRVLKISYKFPACIIHEYSYMKAYNVFTILYIRTVFDIQRSSCHNFTRILNFGFDMDSVDYHSLLLMEKCIKLVCTIIMWKFINFKLKEKSYIYRACISLIPRPWDEAIGMYIMFVKFKPKLKIHQDSKSF